MNTHLAALREQEENQSGTILLSACTAQLPQQLIAPRRTATHTSSPTLPTNVVPSATNYTQGTNVAYVGTNEVPTQGNNYLTTMLDRLNRFLT